jgi:hypothetical protein
MPRHATEDFVMNWVPSGGGAVDAYVVVGANAPTWATDVAEVSCVGRTASQQTDDLRTAFLAARDAGREVWLRGEFEVAMKAHPVASGEYAALIAYSGNVINAHGAYIKLAPVGSSWVGDSCDGRKYGLLRNERMNPGSAALVDRGIRIFGGTWDGNSAAQPTTGGTGDVPNIGFLCDGLEFWRAYDVRVEDATVKNCRGTTGGGGQRETFHCDSVDGNKIRWIRVRCTSDDGGATSTGHSANSSSNVKWIDCKADNMNFHGFTAWRSNRLTRINCESWGNGSAGFRYEEGFEAQDIGCVSGGKNVRGGHGAGYYQHDIELIGGNTGNGLNLKQMRRVSLVGCHYLNNTGHGIQVNHSRNVMIDGGCQIVGNGQYAIQFADNITEERNAGTWSQVYVDPNTYIARNNGHTDSTTGVTNDVICVQGTTGAGTTGTWENRYGTGRHNIRHSGAVGAAHATTNVNPDLPTSGTFMEVVYPFEFDVYFQGGTFTKVEIRRFGRVFDFGPTSYVKIKPGDFLAVTYSSVPTWVWHANFRAGPSLPISVTHANAGVQTALQDAT